MKMFSLVSKATSTVSWISLCLAVVNAAALSGVSCSFPCISTLWSGQVSSTAAELTEHRFLRRPWRHRVRNTYPVGRNVRRMHAAVALWCIERCYSRSDSMCDYNVSDALTLHNCWALMPLKRRWLSVWRLLGADVSRGCQLGAALARKYPQLLLCRFNCSAMIWRVVWASCSSQWSTRTSLYVKMVESDCTFCSQRFRERKRGVTFHETD